MVYKNSIMCTVAATGILLGASTLLPNTFSMVAPAEAATNVSVDINIGTFYDRLEPYGNWVSYQDQYVFLPQHLDRGWRPYTRGHWSYTQHYGWLWVSNERFGWATYHYGRWGYSRDIGWYWVPGRRWAPAWVAWSRGDNEVAWAPLPPRHGNDLEITISIGDVPDYYWQAVPVSAFLSIDLSGKVIRDRDRVRTVVEHGAPETVRIENNIVINNVIEVNYIEKATNTKVKVLEEKTVASPEAAGKTDNNSIAIFNPEVKDAANAKPKKTRKVEEVVTERKAQGIQPEDQPTDQTTAPIDNKNKDGNPIKTTDQPDANATQLDAGKATSEPSLTKQDKSTDTLQPADKSTKNTDTQGKNSKKKQAQPADAQQPDANSPVVEAPVEKSKKKKAVDTNVPLDNGQNVVPQATDQQPSDQQANKKKKGKDAGATDQQPVDPTTTAPADQAAPADGKKKQKKSDEPANNDAQGKAVCDPNVTDCPPAN